MNRAVAALLAVAVVTAPVATLPDGAAAHPGHDHVTSAVADPELPPGFRDEVVFSTGLDQPTAAAQAGDGRFFVLQKDGRLKMFTSLSDTEPDTLVNLETEVHNYIDRGALGLALDPDFASNDFVYVMFSYNFRLHGSSSVPQWSGTLSPNYDDCPTVADGCEISSRIVRYRVSGSQAVEPTVILTDWCQQYFSHSAGALEFGDDGYLYASGGEGARYENNESYDVGQYGNPCRDPVNEGGRFRAQDVRTLGDPNDPTGLSGSVIRIDPATGAPAPGNPLAANPDADTNARRMVAHGFRNPFRMAIRPGTDDLYVGDVGESTFEEVNRIGAGRTALVNAGWPCFEGPARYPDIARYALCDPSNLPDSQVTGPFYKYGHDEEVAFDDECAEETGSISGLEFARDESFPAAPGGPRGGLVFADYARDCLWYLPAGAGGVPNAADPRVLVEDAGNPVDVFSGADGTLYYVDIGIGDDYSNLGGKIHRITYDGGRPTARLTTGGGTRVYGDAPLSVQFDAAGSSDPNGDALTYTWDLDGNGSYETATGSTPTTSRVYTGTTNVVVRVRVSDGVNADVASLTVYPDNSPPDVAIYEPTTALRWAVGQQVTFSGNAIDPDEGELPAAAVDWEFTIEHCPGSCHSHPLLSAPGRKSGAFTTIDHELPSYILARVTATDARGLTSTLTRRLDPAVVRVVLGTTPTGLGYVVDGRQRTRAVTQRMIAGARVQLSVPGRQYLDGRLYRFSSWPGGRPAGHTLVVPRRSEYVHRARFVPVTKLLRVTTTPAGLRFGAQGRGRRSEFSTRVQVGARVRVSAPRFQVRNGYRYRFVRWSDGGARAHSFRMTGRATALRVLFRRAGRA